MIHPVGVADAEPIGITAEGGLVGVLHIDAVDTVLGVAFVKERNAVDGGDTCQLAGSINLLRQAILVIRITGKNGGCTRVLADDVA